MIHLVTGISIFTLTICRTLCSEICGNLIPRDIKMTDLEGDWYRTIMTQNDGEQQYDCSGFTGFVINASTGLGAVSYFGGKHNMPQVKVHIQEKRILVHQSELSRYKCCISQDHVYQAAIIEDKVLCFYFCGRINGPDFVQCYTRRQRISFSLVTRIFHGLRYFGLLLAEMAFRKVYRVGCPGYDAQPIVNSMTTESEQ